MNTQAQLAAASLAATVADTHLMIRRALLEACFCELRGEHCPELLEAAIDAKAALELLSGAKR